MLAGQSEQWLGTKLLSDCVRVGARCLAFLVRASVTKGQDFVAKRCKQVTTIHYKLLYYTTCYNIL